MAEHGADRQVDRPCPGPQGGVARPEQGLARAHFLALFWRSILEPPNRGAG